MWGLALLNGYGTEADSVEGVKMLTAAADREIPCSDYLGYIYCLGNMVDQDLRLGRELLETARSKGSAEAAKAIDYLDASQPSVDT